MSHLQYLPGDPRLVDQLVYELKSKGIFDQFRKECISDVDTRPAYQNLRQRVETSVTSFLSHQVWKPDLNKNQLREKLRKHILDGNYLEQGVERIVDQVVNPKVASVFIPQVEELVYNYLGIARKKTTSVPTAVIEKNKELLPEDLEAVSPGSVKSNIDHVEDMDIEELNTLKSEASEEKPVIDVKEEKSPCIEIMEKEGESQMSVTSEQAIQESDGSIDKSAIPLPAEEIKPENIPSPENSPPKIVKVELEKIQLPREPNLSTDIPLPDEILKEKKTFFKPLPTEDDDSSSDSSLRRNVSPLTPIRNFDTENSCDAQQAFENETGVINYVAINQEHSTFKFTIDSKSSENSLDGIKKEKTASDQSLPYQFDSKMNINTPMYDDSSNSNHLQIDYESDVNSKSNIEVKALEKDETIKDNKKDTKNEDKDKNNETKTSDKESKSDDKKKSRKSSHRSRDESRSHSYRDKRSESKHSGFRDKRDSKDKNSKSSKDDHSKSKSSHNDKFRDRNDNRDSSHKSSKDSKSHRSSSSSHRHSSKMDDRKLSSGSSDKIDKNKEHRSSKVAKSHKSEKDKKNSSSKSKHDDKTKKNRKDTDDHYSLSGRGNHSRRSTDRDSNDGSSSSKGSHHQSNSKVTETKNSTSNKDTTSKSDNTSNSGDSNGPSDKDTKVTDSSAKNSIQPKPVHHVESCLETPFACPPNIPFVQEVILKKPKIAANIHEAKKLVKMRRFLEDEQKRMNQEAALLLEFHNSVRPNFSQVYSSISGPELEFACVADDELKDAYTKQINTKQSKATTFKNDIDTDIDIPESITINVDKNTPAEIYAEFEESIEEAVDCIKTENNELKNDKSVHNLSGRLKKCEKDSKFFEYTIITEELSDNEDKKSVDNDEETIERLHFFAEHEKYEAELYRLKFHKFLKQSHELSLKQEKLFLVNCNAYEENIFKEVSQKNGVSEVVNFYKNGYLKLVKPTKNIVKDVNITDEINLPIEQKFEKRKEHSYPAMFSPVKSDCAFELSSDYDAKLEELVNKTSRQQVMEIILGGAQETPEIDYCNESRLENDIGAMLKRKISDVEITDNNNEHILNPNKIRKISESDQISSTTGELEVPKVNGINSHSSIVSSRSKYLGKARRVGLPKPKRNNLPNSPSSDQSVENYEQNAQTPKQTVFGKFQRSKVPRFESTELYKPKLHFLSRKNNVT